MDTNTQNCSRCGKLCRATGSRSLDARLLKRAATPDPTGVCANCAVTIFIRGNELLMVGINRHGVQAVLSAPHVQAQFARVLQAGNADARPEEINWQEVIANWDIPVALPRAKRLSKKSRGV